MSSSEARALAHALKAMNEMLPSPHALVEELEVSIHQAVVHTPPTDIPPWMELTHDSQCTNVYGDAKLCCKEFGLYTDTRAKS